MQLKKWGNGNFERLSETLEDDCLRPVNILLQAVRLSCDVFKGMRGGSTLLPSPVYPAAFKHSMLLVLWQMT